MKKYKVLITDFDGTLARDDKTVSTKNIQAIKGFIARGGVFVVATGRMTSGIDHILKDYGLDVLVASFNGAELTDLKTNQVLYREGVDNKTCIHFLKTMEKLNIHAIAYPNREFLTIKNSKVAPIYAKICGAKNIQVEKMSKYFEENNLDSGKLYIYDDKEVIDKYFEIVKTSFPNLEVVRSEQTKVDINKKGITKGKVCEFIARKFNISLEDISAVGDTGNDLEMLKTVGFPIAVENANVELKEVAKIVAPSNNDDAIKYIIENYCI